MNATAQNPAINIGPILGIGPPTAHLPSAAQGKLTLFVPERFSLNTLRESPVVQDLIVCHHEGVMPSCVEPGTYDIRFCDKEYVQGLTISPALGAAACLSQLVLHDGKDPIRVTLICNGARLECRDGKLHILPPATGNGWGGDVQRREDPVA